MDVPPGADELAPCPVTTIDVDGMGSDRAPGCDLEGSSVQISESLSFAIPAVGEVEVHEGVDVEGYCIVNWGVPGVGIASVKDSTAVNIWGSTPDALELQREQLIISGITLPE